MLHAQWSQVRCAVLKGNKMASNCKLSLLLVYGDSREGYRGVRREEIGNTNIEKRNRKEEESGVSCYYIDNVNAHVILDMRVCS